MLFSSAIFLFLFLPLFLASYFLAPKKWSNLVLLLFSLLFYSWGEGRIIMVMLCSIFADFNAGLLIDAGKKKLGLALSVLTNIGLLIYFKYASFGFENLQAFGNFFHLDLNAIGYIPEIALPLGISFYTFQTLSYTIDVYQGKAKANKNLLQFATYVSMFPQLVAGPIVRYLDVQKQLVRREKNISNFSTGLERFIIGLGKKMIIANTLAVPVDSIFSLPANELSFASAWLGIILYSLQIYFDFSAYSDMAIGLARMLGFRIPENFNYPYVAKSVREFWRRWHISLSNWFRDYLYIPLGGNRKSAIRVYFNLFIVFFITGLWHGAAWNFIAWGLLHGLFMSLERMGLSSALKRLPNIASRSYCLLVVLFTWVLFRADDLSHALSYWKTMLALNQGFYPLDLFLTTEITLVSFIAIVLSTPIYSQISKVKTLWSKSQSTSRSFQIIWMTFILGILFTSITYIATDSYNPFIYFRF